MSEQAQLSRHELLQGYVTAPGSLSHTNDSTKNLAPNLALPWVIRLRYGMVAGEAIVILAMAYVLRLDFPLAYTLAPLLIVLASNAALTRMKDAPVLPAQNTLGALFVLDTLCLTVIFALTGGPMNPFSLLYLVQITLSAVLLNHTWTKALSALSIACFGLLFRFYIPLAAFEGHHPQEGLPSHLIGMWVAFAIGAALITFFTGKISSALREREHEVLVLQEQVARHERLASLATLAAGAAHELGTPLGTIAVIARELERDAASVPGGAAVREDSRLIRSEVERCRSILNRMSGRGAEPIGDAPRKISIKDLLKKTLEEFSEKQRACVVLRASDDLFVFVPEQAAIQSLAALIRNALDANVHGREVTVRAVQAETQAWISVEDQGCGIAEPVLRRIGEPFFTTKEPGRGMGLGTFLVRRFAEQIGGRLSFVSAPGRGTTATLELPLNS